MSKQMNEETYLDRRLDMIETFNRLYSFLMLLETYEYKEAYEWLEGIKPDYEKYFPDLISMIMKNVKLYGKTGMASLEDENNG